MRATSLRLAALLLVVVGIALSSSLIPSVSGPSRSAPLPPTASPLTTERSHPLAAATPATPPEGIAASSAGGAASVPFAAPTPDGWKGGSFFQDVNVQIAGTGLPLGFQEVPYVNDLPTQTLGFWVNLTATAPLVFANLTIWGTVWPGTNTSAPISGFSPVQPSVRPMTINLTDSAAASYFIDVYRFFWPGAVISFNLTVVGENSTPSVLRSAQAVSVPENYPGGFTDNATWVFRVGTPWASANFLDDIAVTTTPNVLGANVLAPNPRQTLDVEISAISIGGVVAPIPAAALDFTVFLNGTAVAYSEPFGPVNHTVMTLDHPIGPYAGGRISFNITAWVPWQGGEVDILHSPQWSFNWSIHGGWWHPVSGLLANAELVTSPNLAASTGGVPGNALTLSTDQPVTVTVHEPIENVTIASAEVVYAFVDGGATHSGTLSMSELSANTSTATLPGLPNGAGLTFSVVAKDIYGDPVSSGNYSYSEAGPTNPALPAGRGLVFIEVLDLSGQTLVPDFSFSIANGTWSASGPAGPLAFATPLLPGFLTPVELTFGAYLVTVHVFGVDEQATILVGSSDATPTVVFFGESHPAVATPGASLPVDSVLEASGLVAAALLTLPLVLWFDERRAKAEEEQRRITL